MGKQLTFLCQDFERFGPSILSHRDEGISGAMVLSRAVYPVVADYVKAGKKIDDAFFKIVMNDSFYQHTFGRPTDKSTTLAKVAQGKQGC